METEEVQEEAEKTEETLPLQVQETLPEEKPVEQYSADAHQPSTPAEETSKTVLTTVQETIQQEEPEPQSSSPMEEPPMNNPNMLMNGMIPSSIPFGYGPQPSPMVQPVGSQFSNYRNPYQRIHFCW